MRSFILAYKCENEERKIYRERKREIKKRGEGRGDWEKKKLDIYIY